MKSISEYIDMTKDTKVSDIHFSVGHTAKFRLDGSLMDAEPHILNDEDVEALARELAGDEKIDAIKDMGEIDMAKTIGYARTRINIFRQQNHFAISLRILSDRIPRMEELGLPEAVKTFPLMQRGLVLITGETGSGKSTTLAAIIKTITETRPVHVITLEDPVEYVHHTEKGLVNQREVGKDTESYMMGLRAILREDPDVILIGEMRDLETIEIALRAAETGHLVFSTLHTNSAAESIDRIVESFPSGKQHQISLQLAACLNAVVSQQLIKGINGGRVLASEIMMVNPAIRTLIRERKTHQIENTIATSYSEGSIIMDSALIKLNRDGKISKTQAIEASHNPEYVKKKLFT